MGKEAMKVLPIGTQTFGVLRKENNIYVDKTKHVLELVKNGRMYFLSRPRRFGKSLLLSTFKELFKGSKELFEGLYIYDKWDWSKEYPVIHLDFATITYGTVEELKLSLNKFVELRSQEDEVIIDKELPLSMKFAQLIEKLHEKKGERVVILVDEYDKPLIDNLERAAYDEVKRALHDFYQVIKASDEHEKFVFLTGVSRFAGLSIFSGLNNLNDITMNYKYLTICGYTQEELEESFKEHIEEAADVMGKTREEMLEGIKRWYNGYSWNGKSFVYNPFSTLMFFDNKEFKDYWYKTGTPTFLIEHIIKKNGLFDIVGQSEVIVSSLSDVEYERASSIDLLFQTGYLTVKNQESREDTTPQYSLDFPNMEVRNAFLSSLLVSCANKEPREIEGLGKKARKALEERDKEGLQASLIELFANIPYDLHIGKESYYHSLILALMRLLGYEVEGEVHTDKGRIDVVLKKGNDIIVIEIKYGREEEAGKLVEEGLRQIREKKYYEKYIGSTPSLLAIGFGKDKEIECRFDKVN